MSSRPPTLYRTSTIDYKLQSPDDNDVEKRISTEKAVERPRRQTPTRGGNYKPTPLTWPYLAVQALLLAVCMAVVIYIRVSRPDSDNTAIITKRFRPEGGSSATGGEEIQMVYVVRETSVVTPQPKVTPLVTVEPRLLRIIAGASSISPDDPGVRAVSDFSDGSPTVVANSDPSTDTAAPSLTPIVSMPPDAGVASSPLAVTTTTTKRNPWAPLARPINAHPNGNPNSVPADDGGDDMTATAQVNQALNTAATGVVAASKTVVDIVGASDTTLVQQATVQTSVGVDGSISVFTAPARTLVAQVGGLLTTRLVPNDGLQAQTQTIVTNVGATQTTLLYTPPPKTFVTSINGVAVTQVSTPPVQGIVSDIAGTPTTLFVVTTPGAPYTSMIVSNVGGTKTTITPPPSTYVTDINGVRITTTSTPSAYVTTLGGSMTTYATVITPRLTTSAIVQTIDGTLTTQWTTLTISSTPAPMPTNIGTPTKNHTVGEQLIEGFTDAEYFAGTFLPTMLAVLLAIPLTIIDLNAKLFQPFHALTRPEGAASSDSLLLKYTWLHAFISPVLQLLRGQPITFVTSLLVWVSWLLVPLASEAIGFKVHGECSHLSISGCGIALGVNMQASHALIAILAILISLLLLLILLLRKWETGVYSNPWSIAGIASLALNREVREPLIRSQDVWETKLLHVFRGKRFQLGFHASQGGEDEYGIVPMEEAENLRTTMEDDESIFLDPGCFNGRKAGSDSDSWRSLPFMALSYTWRIIFTAMLAGLFTIIMYYYTLDHDNPFELFMDSQAFGVKFLFAAVGVVISFFWTTFFVSYATIAPYLHMSRRSVSPDKSVLYARPTNPFYGVYSAVQHKDYFLLASATVTILSHFLPILLSNIPFSLVQTWMSELVCIIMSLVILAIMMAVLIGSLFIRWPHMPVDPRTLAGAIYYVCDSSMLADIDGRRLSTRCKEERAGRVRDLRHRYFYGDVTGVSGRRRVAIDAENRSTDDVGVNY